MHEDRSDDELTQRLRAYESRIPDAEVPASGATASGRRRVLSALGKGIATIGAGGLLAVVLLNMPRATGGEAGSSPSSSPSMPVARVEELPLDTPRRDCGGDVSQVRAIFRIPNGDAFWTIFPEAGLAPELAEVNARLLVVAYDGMWPGGTVGGIGKSPRVEPAPGTIDVCVETVDGSASPATRFYGVYPEIPLSSSVAAASPSPPPPSTTPSESIGVKDTIWRAVVTDLVVRSEPGVADPEAILPARLTDGDRLLVVDGPRTVDGYEWYQVLPLRPDGLRERPFGWVAAASRDGEAWLERETLACLDSRDLDGFLRLSPEERLACYGGRTISFRAGEDGGCGAAGGLPVGFEPRWLRSESGCGFGGEQPGDIWLSLRFPPGASQAYRPGDEVTGHFDDPAAETCVGTANYPGVVPPSRAEAVALCRTEFVVESVVPTP